MHFFEINMKTKELLSTVKKTTLPNGLRIVTENIPSVKSISTGVWVKTGARNETEQQAGITHFIEHMLFKGTAKRTAYEIALSMESVGGFLNAFTSSEYTCYYARSLDSQLDRALEVLSDMVLNPAFPEKEMEKEKKVVIEEMKMYRDSPDSYLFEEFSARLFSGHELGRPILGNEETVSAFTREDLYSYMGQHYNAGNIMVAIAGHVNHEQVVELVAKYFEGIDETPSNNTEPAALPALQKGKLELTKVIEQTHYVLGRRGLYLNHPQRYLLLLANTVLSGGMSSRLHQNIREKYGYCYSVQAFNQAYSDTGIWGVYVGTDKEYVEHVHQLVVAELEKISTEIIPEKELSEAKSQLKGKLLLSQESTGNRMRRLAKSELYYERFITLDELVRDINQVEAEDILKFAVDFFDQDYFIEAVLMPRE